MKTLEQKLSKVEADLKRWQTKLKRATSKVTELDRRRRRYQLQALQPKGPAVAIVTVNPEKPPGQQVVDVRPPDETDDLKMPNFLSRNPDQGTEIAARKPAVDKTKMPLTGRAAQEAIKAQSAKITAKRAKRDRAFLAR